MATQTRQLSGVSPWRRCGRQTSRPLLQGRGEYRNEPFDIGASVHREHMIAVKEHATSCFEKQRQGTTTSNVPSPHVLQGPPRCRQPLGLFSLGWQLLKVCGDGHRPPRLLDALDLHETFRTAALGEKRLASSKTESCCSGENGKINRRVNRDDITMCALCAVLKKGYSSRASRLP